MYTLKNAVTFLKTMSYPVISTNHCPRDSARSQMSSETLKRLPHFEEALSMFPPEEKVHFGWKGVSIVVLFPFSNQT